MKRTGVLLAAAAILALGNAVFFWDAFNHEGPEFEPAWIAFSPDIESEQRANPHNTFFSTEWVDPRHSALRDKEDPRLNLLVRTAVTCSVGEWQLATYFSGEPANPTAEKPAEMPDRLFLGALSDQQRDCVSRDLPPGYQLAKLAESQGLVWSDWSAPALETPEQSPNWNGKN